MNSNGFPNFDQFQQQQQQQQQQYNDSMSGAAGFDSNSYLPFDFTNFNFGLDTAPSSAAYMTNQLVAANCGSFSQSNDLNMPQTIEDINNNAHKLKQTATTTSATQSTPESSSQQDPATDANAASSFSNSNSNKVTPRRITLNAHQQLVTLQFFYDQYPEDAYSDEDLFKLSQSCGLDFELTKRRLANLNGKQRDLRASLFNSEVGHDYDIIVELLEQYQETQSASGEKSRSSSKSGSKNKKSRLTVGLDSHTSTFIQQNSSFTSNSSSSRKRAGKDEKVLVELHHRELLGARFILAQFYVMGQGKIVKDWLAQKRIEVQTWIYSTARFSSPTINSINLIDPCRPYYVPTTAAELLESDIMGPAYLQYTSSLKPKRSTHNGSLSNSNGNGGSGVKRANGNTATVAAAATADINNEGLMGFQGNLLIPDGSFNPNFGAAAAITSSSNGGGWLPTKSHPGMAYTADGFPVYYDEQGNSNSNNGMMFSASAVATAMMSNPQLYGQYPPLSYQPLSTAAATDMTMGMGMMAPSESFASSLSKAATNANTFVEKMSSLAAKPQRMFAGACVFVSNSKSATADISLAINDLAVVAKCSSESSIISNTNSIGSTGAGFMDSLISSLYLWMNPGVIDQASVLSELTGGTTGQKESIARFANISLTEQIGQLLTELYKINKVPEALVMSLGIVGMDNGTCALVIMISNPSDHHLYKLPGVSAKSVAVSASAGGSNKRKRSSQNVEAAANDSSQFGNEQWIQNWKDDWLLVHDRTAAAATTTTSVSNDNSDGSAYCLKSDMVFISRGSFASTCIPNINGPVNMKVLSSSLDVCSIIQPTDNDILVLSSKTLDVVGRLWKDTFANGTRLSHLTVPSSLDYNLKRTVSLNDLLGSHHIQQKPTNMATAMMSLQTDIKPSSAKALGTSSFGEFPDITTPNFTSKSVNPTTTTGATATTISPSQISAVSNADIMNGNATNDDGMDLLQTWCKSSIPMDYNSTSGGMGFSNHFNMVNPNSNNSNVFASMLQSLSENSNSFLGKSSGNNVGGESDKLGLQTTTTNIANNINQQQQQRSISLNENWIKSLMMPSTITATATQNNNNNSESSDVGDNLESFGIQAKRCFSMNSFMTSNPPPTTALNTSSDELAVPTAATTTTATTTFDEQSISGLLAATTNANTKNPSLLNDGMLFAPTLSSSFPNTTTTTTGNNNDNELLLTSFNYPNVSDLFM
ncbi:hypothetical protein H4219_004088 [Mycoemilia scoparia]|uniref:Uncharacterized protein n=1 Tax=Mycoemilia scoparia TaxID=417184 RepID=A0A9W8DRZ1_9FUNG|nr:hypothetical protein H4219_004088 [Mycoemilia scoparia]